MRGEITRGLADVNGAQLYYEVSGEGDPVALVHGFSLDTRMWDGQVDALADRYRAIRYDARGFGKSAIPDGEPFRHADDLRALLNFLDAPAAHLVGLSMGGRIALQHALLYPENTRSLVLVGAALDGFQWSDEWNASQDAIEERARRDGPRAANAMWLEHELFAPALEQPACAARLKEMVDGFSGRNWLGENPPKGIDPPSAHRLADIRVPTLVIVGERDLPDFHRIADALADGMPSAKKAIIAGVGHMSNMENAAAFNALLLDFLQAQSQTV
jgi:3-oxoadipate enol-lactonase